MYKIGDLVKFKEYFTKKIIYGKIYDIEDYIKIRNEEIKLRNSLYTVKVYDKYNRLTKNQYKIFEDEIIQKTK